ncbi:uncharacterized protein LOC126315317 [Schistocerca gregaria]|uniref:uncharacterized protein LOC126315317 n=1 Tax=Schistocerca gregaria TaxID=7010 RepID=UPI00211EEF6B|nr:uncharacterized protein LOC126315317 [Schistocerca gregaria]
MAKAESQRDDLVSSNEKQFIINAINEERRIDGRGIFDYRALKISFGSKWGSVQVQLGQTRVLFVVSCEVVPPHPDRPTEGFFKFNIHFSPMASPAYSGRLSAQGVETTRLVERGLREGGAIDTEALCITAGEKVWVVRLDMHVLDDQGNITDCCSIGAITALHHFRRPDITIAGGTVIVHSTKEKEPVSLSIHHMPICVSFGIFDADHLVVDPSWKEERVMSGKLSVTLNTQNELCAIQKVGGLALSKSSILQATKIAQVKVFEISQTIIQALNQSKEEKLPSASSIHAFDTGIGLEMMSAKHSETEGPINSHLSNWTKIDCAFRFHHDTESIEINSESVGSGMHKLQKELQTGDIATEWRLNDVDSHEESMADTTNVHTQKKAVYFEHLVAELNSDEGQPRNADDSSEEEDVRILYSEHKNL